MPPLIEYKFEDTGYTNTLITIQAYNYEKAMYKLTEIVKHPADFKLIS